MSPAIAAHGQHLLVAPDTYTAVRESLYLPKVKVRKK